jgi:hypothetical protein
MAVAGIRPIRALRFDVDGASGTFPRGLRRTFRALTSRSSWSSGTLETWDAARTSRGARASGNARISSKARSVITASQNQSRQGAHPHYMPHHLLLSAADRRAPELRLNSLRHPASRGNIARRSPAITLISWIVARRLEREPVLDAGTAAGVHLGKLNAKAEPRRIHLARTSSRRTAFGSVSRDPSSCRSSRGTDFSRWTE